MTWGRVPGSGGSSGFNGFRKWWQFYDYLPQKSCLWGGETRMKTMLKLAKTLTVTQLAKGVGVGIW